MLRFGYTKVNHACLITEKSLENNYCYDYDPKAFKDELDPLDAGYGKNIFAIIFGR